MLNLPPVSEAPGLNAYPVLYWNHVGLELNRITHSLGGPQGGPTLSARALGLLHLAMHDAYFSVLGAGMDGNPKTWLPEAAVPSLPAGVERTLTNANAAMTAAAITVIDHQYGSLPASMSTTARSTMAHLRTQLIDGYDPHIDTLSAAHGHGVRVATLILDRLAVKPGEPGAGDQNYEPKSGRFFFRDEPQHPVALVPIDPDDRSKGLKPARTYHGPFYGTTARPMAVTDPAGHRLAHWRQDGAYDAALKEVHALGGAPTLPTTTRKPDQTVAALYWAYDGANMIGTPPRLYNQILRVVAWDKCDPAADPHKPTLDATIRQTSAFVRLFALANVAMADAGKFAWAEKYRFELWRPLSGIREHDESSEIGRDGTEALTDCADPFWLALGAPRTNTDQSSFKPPFPAYPSGHATFGAACFQMARLFYADAGKAMVTPDGTDDIGFAFVSEELNGISRDLDGPHDPNRPLTDQPGLVRTHVKRRFPSLWSAIWENAFSRIWLGVHWRFDAFASGDAIGTNGEYRKPQDVRYSNVWTQKRPADVTDAELPIGGVPLGLGIANDIWQSGMRASDAETMPERAHAYA
ncbi:Phosphatase PAP2 family protein [Paracoccus nototheniae]|uniref:vanadium-dependent haloperoxidase n=1 Tax=Paracoccus nototheniae TaxID=2489002 RepID=UPI00103AA249|nr:vanadium-dependent haloperoxidase [Paracoccus nototheniae]